MKKTYPKHLRRDWSEIACNAVLAVGAMLFVGLTMATLVQS